MNKVRFTTIGGCPIIFRVKEIAVVLAKGPIETKIYVAGNNKGFFVKGSYAQIMAIIEEAEIC
ncbi:hypothetical protein KA005_43690 [bacterium]|nr:hypothetical protein [bacterium]